MTTTETPRENSRTLLVWADGDYIIIHDDQHDPVPDVGLFIRKENVHDLVLALLKAENGDGEQGVVGEILTLSKEV